MTSNTLDVEFILLMLHKGYVSNKPQCILMKWFLVVICLKV